MDKVKTYGYDEVYEATLEYFGGDTLATTTWINKYCLTDKDGHYLELTPDDMHKRMAKKFSEIEDRYSDKCVASDSDILKLSEYGYGRKHLEHEDIYNLFKGFKYVIPAGSVMSGLGSELPVSLSNCWVIDGPDDSIEHIFRIGNEQSQLMKRRGGVGHDLSKLRPAGASVKNSAKSSTGAASFMEFFSNCTLIIAQKGRRGALMLSMGIEHPDAEAFIEMKQDLTKVTGANVSVQIPDEFMEAVEANGDYYQRWPIDRPISAFNQEQLPEEYDTLTEVEYSPVVPVFELSSAISRRGYVKKIKAADLWNKLIHCAWNTAEPGIIFRTRHHQYSPDGVYPSFRGTCTNPCGEIFMNEDSCRLIHMNLASFVEDGKLQEEKLYEYTYEAMRLADDLVDLEADAINRIIKKIEDDGDRWNSEWNLYTRLLKHSLEGRRCGLGFTGMADLIAELGYKYDSDEALKAIKHVMRIMFVAEMDCTIDMARTRGWFPARDGKLEFDDGNEWYKWLHEEFPHLYEKMKNCGRRNISFNTVAPTGTVSLLARTSSGIEPVFMPVYTRRVKCTKPDDRVDFVDKVGEKYTEYVTIHPGLYKWAAKKYNGDDVRTYTAEQWEEVYRNSPWYGSTANDIDWERRVELQGIVQRYITHSISSTVNLPNNVSESVVSTIYMESWKKGLKGITVYRDGCRNGVMVSTSNAEQLKAMTNDAKKRPDVLDCKVIRFRNNGEKWVSVIGLLDGEPYEIFTGLQEELSIPNWVETGKIVRHRNAFKNPETEKVGSRYDLCYTDKGGYEVCIQGLSRIFNPEYWNYGKLISGLLRHHMPLWCIINVISTLDLDSSNINTWKNGVIRALKKFDTSERNVGEPCPECGGKLVREGGCIQCKDCGWSRCE